MATLTHSPARVTQQVLIDLGLAVDPDLRAPPAQQPDWVVTRHKKLPAAPDRVVWVVNTTGQDDGRAQFTGELLQHYGVQVGVRGRTEDDAWERAATVRAGLAEDATGRVAWVGETSERPDQTPYLVNSYNRVPAPVRVGQEAGSDRFLFTLNPLMSVRPYPYPSAAGLYRFDGDLTDSSGNALDFTAGGGEAYGTSVFGSGLQAGAPTRAQTLLAGDPFTGSYSLGAWFTRLGSGTVTVRLTNGAGTSVLWVVVSATGVELLTSNGGIVYSESYPVDDPRHVWLSVDRGDAVVYLDGEVEATYDFSVLNDGNTFATGGTGNLTVEFSAADRFRVDELVLLSEALPAWAVAALARGTNRYPN